MVLLFSLAAVPFANRLVKLTRLVLEPDGLRYLKPGFETSLRWDEIVALKSVRSWGVRGLELHKREGGYLLLVNFQEMDEITRYIEMRVTPQETTSLRWIVFLRRYSRMAVWGLLMVGALFVWLDQAQPGRIGLGAIGLMLLVIGALGFKSAMPLNMRRGR